MYRRRSASLTQAVAHPATEPTTAQSATSTAPTTSPSDRARWPPCRCPAQRSSPAGGGPAGDASWTRTASQSPQHGRRANRHGIHRRCVRDLHAPASEDLRDRLIRLRRRKPAYVTTQALNDAGDRASRYLLMQSLVNTIYGVAIGVGLWVIGKLSPNPDGFPNAPLWGLLCGLLRFVPYIGPWLGAICPVLLSFAVFPGVSQFVYTICLFVGVELLNSSRPRTNHVRLEHRPLRDRDSRRGSLLDVAVGADWIAAQYDPLTVCVVVIGKYVPQLQFLDISASATSRHCRRQPGCINGLLALDPEGGGPMWSRNITRPMPLEEPVRQGDRAGTGHAEEDSHRGQLDEQRHARCSTAHSRIDR